MGRRAAGRAPDGDVVLESMEYGMVALRAQKEAAAEATASSAYASTSVVEPRLIPLLPHDRGHRGGRRPHRHYPGPSLACRQPEHSC